MDYHFDIQHAQKYGVDEAIVLKNLIYWIRVNKANGKNRIEGRVWCYNTIDAWQQQYPFWSPQKLWRILSSLQKQGVIFKHCLGGGHDRTTYYALADESMLELPENRQITGSAPDNDLKVDQDPKGPKENSFDKRSRQADAEEIHTFYKLNVQAGRSQRAVKNIKKLLKKYTKKQLIDSVKNYIEKCRKENIQYKIQPQNFFGESEDFKDYFPKKPPKLMKPNPDCKVCGGDGEVFSQATSRVSVCNCRIINDKGG